MGWGVPRQQAKWRQTAQRQDDPRQCDVTGHAGRSGLGALAHERELSFRQYHRLARRLGKKKAVVAVSHSLLVIIYHVLSTKQPYSDLGADYFEQRDSARLTQRSVRQLEALGYKVTLVPKEVA